MTDDRLEIAKQVAIGNLSEDYITLEEAQELLLLVKERAMELTMIRLAESNPVVFFGVDNGTIN